MSRGWPKGSHLTEEHKQKISESHKKPENWIIHHDVRKRIYLTEEQKAAISASVKGIPQTDEHKQKVLANRNRWRLSIDDKVYESIAEAARDLDIRYHVLVRIVKHYPQELEEIGHHLDWIEEKQRRIEE